MMMTRRNMFVGHNQLRMSRKRSSSSSSRRASSNKCLSTALLLTLSILLLWWDDATITLLPYTSENLHRYLQEKSSLPGTTEEDAAVAALAAAAGTTTPLAAAPPDAPPQERALPHSVILRSTLQIYGTISAFLVALYVLVRNQFPRVYNVRNAFKQSKTTSTPTTSGGSSNYASARTTAATVDFFGPIDWTYKVLSVPHELIFEKCGLDAVTTIRILEFGIKLSFVGILNSTYLFAVYDIIGERVYHPATAGITDPVQNFSLSNVPPGHASIVATTISAYVMACAAMYLILQEFKFFTKHRHVFLTRKRPNNYTVCVSGLPLNCRSDEELVRFFRECFHHGAEGEGEEGLGSTTVLEAHVALNVPRLERKVAERTKVVTKLEHAINVAKHANKHGVRPMHRTKPIVGKKVDSIDVYTRELHELNDEIGSMIRTIEDRRKASRQSTTSSGDRELQRLAASSDLTTNDADGYGSSAEDKQEILTTRASPVDSLSGGAASAVSDRLFAQDDGRPLDAAFVTFADLTSTNAALQMIHEGSPFVMDVTEAPRPDDIYWANVGWAHGRKQAGALLGLVLTTLLCLFWTVPVGFVASLSNVDALTDLIPVLGVWVDRYPWFGPFLAQLAPLLLVIVVSLLPVILHWIAKLEGHIAETAVQSSVFVKLAWFTIIQTFFISAISGSVTAEIQNIIRSPVHAVDLLAKALPAQSAYFMQIMLVQTFLGIGIELLRVSPVGMAIVRSVVGPNLTEKERSTTYMGLRPLADPAEYPYAKELGAEIILIFMVLFCYASMAPLTCYACGFCFFVLSVVLRNQFLFVYPTTNDSGGKLWAEFIQIIVICMIVAQVALVGVLSLKKATIAAPLLVPLPIVTVLFSVYLKQKHYYVTSHLPTKVAVQVDKENKANGSIATYDFVRGKYVQPALKNQTLLPENFEGAQGDDDSKSPSQKQGWMSFLSRTALPHKGGGKIRPAR